MALRYVKDLDPVQWKTLTDALKRGPTKEQQKIIKEALELTKHLDKSNTD